MNERVSLGDNVLLELLRGRDAIRALRELVELHDRTKREDAADYERRKPAAWAEARRVLEQREEQQR